MPTTSEIGSFPFIIESVEWVYQNDSESKDLIEWEKTAYAKSSWDKSYDISGWASIGIIKFTDVPSEGDFFIMGA